MTLVHCGACVLACHGERPSRHPGDVTNEDRTSDEVRGKRPDYFITCDGFGINGFTSMLYIFLHDFKMHRRRQDDRNNSLLHVYLLSTRPAGLNHELLILNTGKGDVGQKQCAVI